MSGAFDDGSAEIFLAAIVAQISNSVIPRLKRIENESGRRFRCVNLDRAARLVSGCFNPQNSDTPSRLSLLV